MRHDTFINPAFVHERWGDLPDARLVAVCADGHSATELAKALAIRARGATVPTYIVTDCGECSQMAWTAERASAEDAAKAALL